MRDISPRTVQPRLEVCFEEGAIRDRCECLRFESEGVVFQSAVRFEEMSGVLLRFHCCGAADCAGDVTVGGVVIDCRETGTGNFETTVFFDVQGSCAEKPGHCSLLRPCVAAE